jgi:hypothetical protein
MGVRLVYYNKLHSSDGTGIFGDHDELINRDIPNQHPIFAITGLQEILNIIENLLNQHTRQIRDINTSIVQINNTIDGIQQDIIDINARIDALHTIENVVDTRTFDFDYNGTTKTLTGDVRVYDDEKNALLVTEYGLYCPKPVFKDTNTVEWTHIMTGESLEEIFQYGSKFSHNTNSWSDLYSPSEANRWYWDATRNSFVQPANTSYYNGLITKGAYDNYVHRVRIRSTDGDDDVNGVIIGHVIDENGHPHTLEVLICRTGFNSSMTYALAYDYYLPDQQILFRAGNGAGGSTPTGSGSGGWSGRPNGIVVQVEKNGKNISVLAGAWNDTSENLEEKTRITIDLDNYSWGYLFKGFVKYGYSNISQANTFYQVLYFKGLMSGQEDIYQAYAIVSPDAHNALKERTSGLWVEEFQISPDENNALVHRDNGYFVQKLRPSDGYANGVTITSDGLVYCRQGKDYKLVDQTSHGFVVGDFIYYHPVDMKYYKAIAKDDYDINVVGMVTRVISANQFEYMWSGFFTTDLFTEENGYLQGMPLYVSDKTAGKVVQKQPDISKAVAYPVEDTGIMIAIERGIQYNNEATIGDFKKSLNTYNVRSDGFIRIVPGIEYKQSLIQLLLDTVTMEFKNNYMIIDDVNGTVEFQNTDALKELNDCGPGVELFIKAF